MFAQSKRAVLCGQDRRHLRSGHGQPGSCAPPHFVNKHDSCDSHWPVVLAGRGDFFCMLVLSSDRDGRCNLKQSSKRTGHTQRLWGCRMLFDPEKTHSGCIVVSLGSQLQEAQTVASWPQRAWYWSVYPEVHRIRSGSWRFTNSLKQPSRPAFHHWPHGQRQSSFVSSISQYVVSEAYRKQRCMFWWHLQIFDFFAK